MELASMSGTSKILDLVLGFVTASSNLLVALQGAYLGIDPPKLLLEVYGLMLLFELLAVLLVLNAKRN